MLRPVAKSTTEITRVPHGVCTITVQANAAFDDRGPADEAQVGCAGQRIVQRRQVGGPRIGKLAADGSAPRKAQCQGVRPARPKARDAASRPRQASSVSRSTS